MNVIEVIIIGMIMLIGLGCQIAASKNTKRLAVSGIVSAIVFAGTFAIATIRLIDKSSFDFGDWMSWVAKATIFVVICNLKSYFSPAIFACVLSYAIYGYFEYDKLQLLPVLSNLLDWLFGKMPTWVEGVYMLFMLCCTGIAGIDAAEASN